MSKRPGIAALSEQPRGVDLDITETMLHRACEAYDPMYDACGGDTRADMKQSMRRALEAVGLAAPQPREAPGDVWGRLEKWLGTYADSIPTAAYQELVAIQRATTPQDAAGVKPNPYCYKVEWSDGVTKYPSTLPEFIGNALVTPLYTTPPPGVDVGKLREEVERLNAIINTPQADDFLRAVSTEAEHQRQRWGTSHDAGKEPADWFWLIGYLAGKALHAHTNGDIAKAEHHVITTGAACANWHRAMFGQTDMRPGIDGTAIDAAAPGVGNG